MVGCVTLTGVAPLRSVTLERGIPVPAFIKKYIMISSLSSSLETYKSYSYSRLCPKLIFVEKSTVLIT